MNLEHSIKEESHERYPVHLKCLRNIKKIKYPDFQAMTSIHTLLKPTVKYMGEDQHKYDLLMMHYVLTKLAKNIFKQCQKQIAKYNASLPKHHKFSVGDRVYLFNHTKQNSTINGWLET